MDYLLLHERRVGGVTVLAAIGELDQFSGVELANRLDGLAALGRHRVVLDAVGVTFCDVHGIRILMSGNMRARTRGGWLRLVRADWRLQKALSIMSSVHAGEALAVYDSVGEAVGEGAG